MRFPALVASVALAASTLALTPSPAPASAVAATSTPAVVSAVDTAAARAATTWLARDLTGGRLDGPMAGFVDWGVTIDALFALEATGAPSSAVAAVAEALGTEGVAAYTQYAVAQYDAKALVAALVAGEDPRTFGGKDLVAATRAGVTTTGANPGQLKGAGMFGHALAVIGLAGARQNDAAAIAAMLRQQCAAGWFRFAFAGDGRSCDETANAAEQHPDATAMALSAMLAARRAGATGLDDAISRARAWLVGQQRPDGAWTGDRYTPAENTNSTGLVVQALSDAGGAADAVARGAAWIRTVQVSAATATGTVLAAEPGAIAYAKESFDAAVAAGSLLDGQRDQWRRASAQAVLGLARVSFSQLVGLAPRDPAPVDPPRPPAPLPAVTLTVAAPTAPVLRGRTITVTASRLAAREAYTIAVAGRRVRTGNADARGTLHTSLVVPTSLSEGRRTVSVVGSRAHRTGATSVLVVRAKALPAKVTKKKVRRGKKQVLTVRGLAPGERVTVTYRGKRVSARAAKANARGVAKVRFAVGRKAGKTKVTVRGAYASRKRTVAFKVVR